jgi:hypothetical protein
MVQMEDNLRRAVVVVIESARQGFEVSSDVVTGAIQQAFGFIPMEAFSIRPFEQ